MIIRKAKYTIPMVENYDRDDRSEPEVVVDTTVTVEEDTVMFVAPWGTFLGWITAWNEISWKGEPPDVSAEDQLCDYLFK